MLSSVDEDVEVEDEEEDKEKGQQGTCTGSADHLHGHRSCQVAERKLATFVFISHTRSSLCYCKVGLEQVMASEAPPGMVLDMNCSPAALTVEEIDDGDALSFPNSAVLSFQGMHTLQGTIVVP